MSRSRRNSIDYITEKNASYLEGLESYISESEGTNVEKLKNFAKYTPRQNIAFFLRRYEIFKRILNVQGSIIECGVFLGGGLMSFAQFSAILEPTNFQRKIFGFDTFKGFPDLSEKDEGRNSIEKKVGGFAGNAKDDLEEAIQLFDQNRFLSHIPKVELIEGDATRTIPSFIDENPHLVISLLCLDFDIYEPTKVALKHFLPRMPKGSIIYFDEVNIEEWPGETLAVVEEIGINNLHLERFSFDSTASYAVLR